MNKSKILVLSLLVFITSIHAQTSGPDYIKAQLTASGVYATPAYEFDPTYDNLNTYPNMRGMFFDGLPYPESTNVNGEIINLDNKTKVFCWYGEPAGLGQGDKVPAVILIHGGGGQAFEAWVKEWTDRGYIAIALSLINKLPQGLFETEFPIPEQQFFFSDNDEVLQNQWFYHAIGDAMLAHSLLRDTNFTSHVDIDHIGVTGISWGGINNTVLAGIDERLDFVIPVYGCAYLTDSPVYSRQFNNMSAAAQAFYLDNWEPSLYLPYHTAPMLFVDGNKDLQFTLNIFSKTFENSASLEKYLRVEDLMPHGHAPGREPQDIYDFADYVTGFNASAVEPLRYTSESIDTNNLKTYEYAFEGIVDEAELFYCEDTLQWGKFDPDFIWLKKPASLTVDGSGGVVTVTVPDEAQVSYLNINNTADGNIFTSALRYHNSTTYYDWYNYGSAEFNTLVNSTLGGTLTENVDNPDTTGINTNTQVGKFQIEAGSNSRIEFNLITNITDLSSFKQKVKTYVDESISGLDNTKIRIYMLNESVGYGTSVFQDFTLTTGQSWIECEFDFSGVAIPAEVSAAGGFDQVAIMFAPDDVTTNGTVYYFDGLRGTIEQIVPEVYYDWFDYGVNSAVVNIDVFNSSGGVFDEYYDVSTDPGVFTSGSDSGKASKFIKTAGDFQFTQVRYNFEDGAIEDTESITFRLKALFKPETTSEINVLDENTRAVQLFFRDNIGNTNKNQLSSSVAYFTQTNAWETLEFTFESDELEFYDRFMIMVTPSYTNPIDENGIELDEDLTYYFESLTANENIDLTVATDELLDLEKSVIVYPNPVDDLLNINIKNYEDDVEIIVLSVTGKKLMTETFKNQESIQMNISKLPEGIYFINVLNFQSELIKVKKIVKH